VPAGPPTLPATARPPVLRASSSSASTRTRQWPSRWRAPGRPAAEIQVTRRWVRSTLRTHSLHRRHTLRTQTHTAGEPRSLGRHRPRVGVPSGTTGEPPTPVVPKGFFPPRRPRHARGTSQGEPPSSRLSPGHPQQRLGGQEAEHTLYHLREVTQHVGAPWVCGAGAAAIAATAAHRLHASPTRLSEHYGGSKGPAREVPAHSVRRTARARVTSGDGGARVTSGARRCRPCLGRAAVLLTVSLRSPQSTLSCAREIRPLPPEPLAAHAPLSFASSHLSLVHEFFEDRD
jgi:hypothetical protein